MLKNIGTDVFAGPDGIISEWQVSVRNLKKGFFTLIEEADLIMTLRISDGILDPESFTPATFWIRKTISDSLDIRGRQESSLLSTPLSAVFVKLPVVFGILLFLLGHKRAVKSAKSTLYISFFGICLSLLTFSQYSWYFVAIYMVWYT